MSVPIQIIIGISSDNREKILDTLKTYEYGQVPYLIDISRVEKQRDALATIESFCDDYGIHQLPAPFAVLCGIHNYRGKVRVINSIEEFPKFYIRKNKTLNVKESRLSLYYRIKCEVFSNFNQRNAKESIEEYADQHKTLSHLCSEGEYLEKLLKRLKYQEANNG